MTVKIRYIGPHTAVELERFDGTVAVVEHGELLETEKAHAERLLEQATNWEPEKKPARSAKAEKDGGDKS